MKKIFFGILATIGGMVLFSIISLIIIAKVTMNQQQTIHPNTVLLVEFSGTMTENAHHGGLSSFLEGRHDSLYHLVQAIDQASKDPRVKGIVARIDHAKMGLAQAQELRNAIMRFRVLGRDSNKFTIAHTDTFGEMSPGTTPYYIASAFEEIWLQPMGEICMTGIYAEIPFAKTALDEIGIKARIGKREEFKTAYDSLTETGLTQANKESTQDLLNSLMNQIVRDIALARELSEADIWDAVNKGPLFGTEALKLGLIDRQDYFDEIKAYTNSKVTGEMHIMLPHQYLDSNPMPEPKKGKSKIALIYGSGVLMRSASENQGLLGGEVMGSDQMKKAFDKAAKDDDVVAIVFRINSPGGSPVASESVLRAVRKAQQAGKPVIVSMSDVAASGGYWIAAYADRIVAHPSSITGSIGVLGGKLITKEAWAKIGVNWGNVHTGDNASMWSSSEDYTAHGWERLQGSLDNIYKGFIDRVAEGRKLPREHVLQVAKGRVWSGEDALKYGLIDKLGDLKEAIELAKEAVSLKDQIVPVEVFPKPIGLGEQIQKVLLGEEDLDAPDMGVLSPLMRILHLVKIISAEVSVYIRPSGETVVTPIKKIEG
jgi:protease-4